jgi:CHAT domain-containing protein
MIYRFFTLLLILISFQTSAQSTSASDSIEAESLLLKGQALWEAGELEAAQPILQKAFKLFTDAAKRLRELETLQILLPLLIISNQDKPLQTYLKELRNEHKEYPAERAAVFDQISRIYQLRHNPKAATYAEKQAIELYKEAGKTEKAAALLYWKSLHADKKLDRLMYLDQAEKLLDSLKSNTAQDLSIQIRNAKASSCLDYHQLQEADSLLSKNLSNKNNSLLLAATYLQLGRLYWYKESYQQAESTFAKSYLLFRNKNARQQMAELYYYWGSLKAELGKKKTALTYFERALNQLQLGDKLKIDHEFGKNLHIVDQKLALHILLGYSQIAPKKQALTAIRNGIKLIKHFNMNTGLPQYHDYYDEIYQRGFELLVTQNKSIHNKEKVQQALNWMEERRLQKIAAALFPDYPSIKNDSLLLIGQTIHLRYRQQIQQYALQQSSIFKDKLKYWDQLFVDWKKNLQTVYPELYQLRFHQLNSEELEQLSNKIGKNEALIFYYLDEKSAYAATISSDQKHSLYQLQMEEDYVHKIINLQELLAQPLTQSLALCTNALMQFHQDWLSPLNIQEKESLIILADGPLLYIPFEAAIEKSVQSNKNFNELDYLLLTKEIQYQYCLKDMLDAKNDKKENEGNILAFAANYKLDASAKDLLTDIQWELRQKLKALPQAQKELNMLFERFRGSFYNDETADEASLKHLAPENSYSVIHIGMRSLSKDKQLALAFNFNPKTEEDDFLTAAEILNTAIAADLVVLSALNFGKAAWTEKYHDQYLGLEYSFVMKGAPSIVKTLWETDLNSSVQIMELFYELLSRGYLKSEALTEAKRVYVSEARSDLAHPYYWANIIHSGNPKVIELRKRSFIERYWFYGMLIVFSILGLAVFAWRINQMSLGRQ